MKSSNKALLDSDVTNVDEKLISFVNDILDINKVCVDLETIINSCVGFFERFFIKDALPINITAYHGLQEGPNITNVEEVGDKLEALYKLYEKVKGGKD